MGIKPNIADAEDKEVRQERELTRMVYLKERGGGIHTKEFDTKKKCHKYLRRHHDSVIAYEEYLVNEDGSEMFVKKGQFTPRTENEKRKARSRLRRKRRARERAKAREREGLQSLRTARW